MGGRQVFEADHLQSVDFIGQIEIALHVHGCAINLQILAPNVSNTWIFLFLKQRSSIIDVEELEPTFFK